MASGWAGDEDSGREKLIAMEGHEAYVPTDEEVALWREAAAPLKDSWTQAVTGAGHDADAVFQGLVDALEERDAAY